MMGRPRAIIDKHKEIEEVIAQYNKEQVGWKKERLLAIKLLVDANKSYKEVAEILERTESIVRVWTQAYRSGGVSELLTRGNGGGRKGKLTVKVTEELVDKLREGCFRTAKQFQEWLREEHQIELSEKGIYYHLGKLGGRLKVPRPSHLKKDE